jgi:hypothetical protein
MKLSRVHQVGSECLKGKGVGGKQKKGYTQKYRFSLKLQGLTIKKTEGSMKPFKSLNLGFLDAENYLERDNKAFFSQIFLKDDNLDNLLRSSTYFLIGEKGTGKTAYSVFLSNGEYKETRSSIKYIRETDYTKFIELKKQKNLGLSDFSSIWKVILLVLISKQIETRDLKVNFIQRKDKIDSLVHILDDYCANAFSPEIINALSIVENEELMGLLKIQGIGEFGAKSGISLTSQSKNFQIELLRIEREFKKSLECLKLKNNILLFIDGIDIRPGSIDYNDYLECIKGLADAAWNLNRDFFGNIRDSQGRFRIVLLLRPDIFNSLGLQNDANKLRDNSVFLDWRTKYPICRDSKIFKLIDRLFSTQQEQQLAEGKAWDNYFPWSRPSTNENEREEDQSFISFLRMSYSRPRDIIASLQILQDEDKRSDIFAREKVEHFFSSPDFKERLSEYMLRSIKNQTSFYYTDDEYNMLILFFDYFHRPDFTWEEYCVKFEEYVSHVEKHYGIIPVFASTKEIFIQFLYDTNIICYIEDMEYEPMFRWCYRERDFSRIAPKVKYNLRYRVHYSLYKALNIGHQSEKSI